VTAARRPRIQGNGSHPSEEEEEEEEKEKRIKGRLSQSVSGVLGADHFLTQSILIYMRL